MTKTELLSALTGDVVAVGIDVAVGTLNAGWQTYDVSCLVTVNADGCTDWKTQPIHVYHEGQGDEDARYGKIKLKNWSTPPDPKDDLMKSYLDYLVMQNVFDSWTFLKDQVIETSVVKAQGFEFVKGADFVGLDGVALPTGVEVCWLWENKDGVLKQVSVK